MKPLYFILVPGLMALALSSCQHSTRDEDRERIPEPPPGSTKRLKPWNQTQRFEGEAILGPIANPRR